MIIAITAWTVEVETDPQGNTSMVACLDHVRQIVSYTAAVAL